MKRVGLLGICLVLSLPCAPGWAQAATQPVGPSAVPAASEVDRLKRELADLKKTVETLRTENDKLKKQWNDAVLNGTGETPSVVPAAPTATAPATRPATTQSGKIDQDGPGLYRVSAGPNRRFTTTLRAKSREDAITLLLKTVGKTAMAFDENQDLNELHVERLGP